MVVTIAAFGRAAADGTVLIGGGPGRTTAPRSAPQPARSRQNSPAPAGSGVLVGATYPLAEVAAAHRAIMSSQSPSKSS